VFFSHGVFARKIRIGHARRYKNQYAVAYHSCKRLLLSFSLVAVPAVKSYVCLVARMLLGLMLLVLCRPPGFVLFVAMVLFTVLLTVLPMCDEVACDRRYAMRCRW